MPLPPISSPVGVSGSVTNSTLNLTLGNSTTKIGTTIVEVIIVKLTGGTTPGTVVITGLNTSYYNDNGTVGQLTITIPPNTVVPINFMPTPLEGGPLITFALTAGASQTLGILTTGHFNG